MKKKFSVTEKTPVVGDFVEDKITLLLLLLPMKWLDVDDIEGIVDAEDINEDDADKNDGDDDREFDGDDEEDDDEFDPCLEVKRSQSPFEWASSGDDDPGGKGCFDRILMEKSVMRHSDAFHEDKLMTASVGAIFAKISEDLGDEGTDPWVLATKGTEGSLLPTELWAVMKNSYAVPHSRFPIVWVMDWEWMGTSLQSWFEFSFL